jgi:isopenicillin-N N-acyltransferase-like protein
MKEIVLSGSYRTLGRQYGKACRRQIKLFTKMVQVMAALSERPGATFFEPRYRNVPLVLAGFFKNRHRYRTDAHGYIDTLQEFYPESLELLHGMAEGANVDFDDLIFLNAAAEASLHCTAVAAAGAETATGEPILAMNADEVRGTERFEVMLDIRPDTGYWYQVCALAGVLYYNFGMNEKGLSMLGTFLFVRNEPAALSRIPMLLYFSLLNRCATVDEAQELLESLPRSDVGTVLYVGDADKFLRMEQSAMGREIEIVASGLRWNANFPKTATLAPFSMLDELEAPTTLFARNRMMRLEHFAETYHGAFDADSMYTILSDHGDHGDGTFMRSMCMHPRHAAGKQTCASIIALPRQLTMRIYAANPCRNDVTEYATSVQRTST